MCTQITASYTVRSIFVLHILLVQVTYLVMFNEITPKISQGHNFCWKLFEFNQLFLISLTLVKVERDSFPAKPGSTCTKLRGRIALNTSKHTGGLKEYQCHQMLPGLIFMFILLTCNLGVIFFVCSLIFL